MGPTGGQGGHSSLFTDNSLFHGHSGFRPVQPVDPIRHFRNVVHPHYLYLGLLDDERPRPGDTLFADGVDAGTIRTWCDGGYQDDAAWHHARLAAGGAAVLSGGALTGQYGLACALPASLDGRRRWVLFTGRRDRPFDASERVLAALALRLQQVSFDHVSEPGLNRLLLTEEDHLLHADPLTLHEGAREPRRVEQLAALVGPVVRQRWPEREPGRCHDLMLHLWGGPRWARWYEWEAQTGLPRYRLLEVRPLSEDDAPAAGLVSDPRVARALGYLTDHFTDSPTLDQTAAAMDVSPFHFHRLFLREVGVSPKHFLLRFQLQVAKWLLRTTQHTVGEVAAMTGFSSHGHFTATFHRVVGVNPTRYREGEE